MTAKRDNSELWLKIAARQRAHHLAADGPLLETCCGMGAMHVRAWRPLGRRGLALDAKLECARAAARRPGWLAIRCDAAKLLADPAWTPKLAGFALVDLDVYGSPWRLVDILTANSFPGVIVATDGYRSRVSLCKPCAALFPEQEAKPMLDAARYEAVVRARFGPRGYRFERIAGRKMDQWIVTRWTSGS